MPDLATNLLITVVQAVFVAGIYLKLMDRPFDLAYAVAALTGAFTVVGILLVMAMTGDLDAGGVALGMAFVGRGVGAYAGCAAYDFYRDYLA